MSDNTLPAPLVPAEVDLRDFQYMELDVRVLRDSRFAAQVTGDAFRAGVLLWCAAWHQVPAGSLLDDDIELANLAGYGRFTKEWLKVRPEALHKFLKCSDGRLYHLEVSQKALTAWNSRLQHHYDKARDRLRKANKARAAAGQPVIAEFTFEQWNERRLSAGIPMEKADASAGIPQKAPPENSGIPPENALKGKGNGEGDSSGDGKDSGGIPEGTQAGAICKALKQAGVRRVNPGELRFKALVDAGATVDEFMAYVSQSLSKGDPFSYLVSTVANERTKAAEMAKGLLKGAMPTVSSDLQRMIDRGNR